MKTTITADVNEFKQSMMALINSALENNEDIRITTKGGSAVFSINKTSPELMTDQEYITSDPTWVKELIESKNAPMSDYYEWDWRKQS